MATGVDSRTVLCVARQPILNRARRVYGYELLYRDVPSATACDSGASNIASSRVLTDAVLAVGLDRLTAGKPAFVNFTRSLLMSGAGILLPPAAMVIEILENVEVDKDVVKVCRQLRARGYALALDDFVPGSSAEQLVPHAKFVKVDVLSTPLNERIKLAARLKPLGIRLIAEKVETEEMAITLLHECLHIYFDTIRHRLERWAYNTATCYERYVLLCNGIPIPPAVTCPSKIAGIGELAQPSDTEKSIEFLTKVLELNPRDGYVKGSSARRKLHIAILTVPLPSAKALHDQLKAGTGALGKLFQGRLHTATRKWVLDMLWRKHLIHSKLSQ